MAAQPEGVRDDFAKRLHVWAVLTHRVRALGKLGGASAFQQHGIGEPLDTVCGETGDCRDLVDGLTSADTGLDLTRTHRGLHVGCHLAKSSDVTAGRCAQALIGRKQKSLAAFRVFADDRLAICVEPDDPQRSHVGLPDDFTSSIPRR
jgi:hypothetical protein